jgi:hypothetical protein
MYRRGQPQVPSPEALVLWHVLIRRGEAQAGTLSRGVGKGFPAAEAQLSTKKNGIV